MFNILRRLRKNESGATAIEYGLIAALIAVAAIGAMTTLGGNLTDIFTTAADELETANSGASSSSSTTGG